MSTYILVVGGPINGFSHFGPFDNEYAAVKFGDDQHGKDVFYVVELITPESWIAMTKGDWDVDAHMSVNDSGVKLDEKTLKESGFVPKLVTR